VCVLVIQHAMRMRHIVVCGLSVSKIFFFPRNYVIKDMILEKKVTEHKMCIFIYSTLLV